jgi:hypothetical protein
MEDDGSLNVSTSRNYERSKAFDGSLNFSFNLKSPDVMTSPMMLIFAPILEYEESPTSDRRRVLLAGRINSIGILSSSPDNS